MNVKVPVQCCLCGEMILKKTDLSGEHVPPKLFHPKSMRASIRKQLWKVSSHVDCNQSFRKDEEYTYVYVAGLVSNQNPVMGKVILDDLKTRAKDPQVKGLVRRYLKECQNITPGGVHLPPGHFFIQPDTARITRVVLKMAQCIYYMEHQKHLPHLPCKHCERIDTVETLQPLYRVILEHGKPYFVISSVFIYRYLCIDGVHLFNFIFWESFSYCLAYDDPEGRTDFFFARQYQETQ